MRDWNKEIPGWYYREAAKQRPKSKVLDFLFCSGPIYIQAMAHIVFVIFFFTYVSLYSTFHGRRRRRRGRQ